MHQLSFQSIRVDSRRLLDLVLDVLVAQGVSQEDASYVAWHLVETNLRGTDSHGVARLPHYVRRLRAGSICPQPEIRLARKASSLGILDGGNGLGHLVMRRAAEEAASLALQSGAGWVSVRNSSHCGALAPFGLWLAERGMVSFVLTHVDPMVLPYGAAEPFCGTNPLCFTAPGSDGRTVCLDMATSIVPWNVIANAQSEGVAIPIGWAVDAMGLDTVDPTAVRALYPFGEHKGSGLGVMIDVLCAMFSDAPFGPDIPKMYGDFATPRRLGGLVGAIHVDAFTSLSAFCDRVAHMTRRLGDLKATAGVDRVRYPGEPELEEKKSRQMSGIPVGLQVFAELNALASEAGTALLKPFLNSGSYGAKAE